MNNRDSMEKDRAERSEIAAEWLVTLQDPALSHEQFLRWELWMEESPLNQQAFDDMGRLSRRATALKAGLVDMPLPSRSEIASDAYTGDLPVATWFRRRDKASHEVHPAFRWRGLAKAAAVAAVAVALGLTVITELPDGAPTTPASTYETAISEHREITLADGSLINLGAKSSLTIDYTSEQRLVTLETGEALFTVARNPGRPFIVIAGSGTITAIGTAFNVRRDAAHVVVTVTEGKVEVARRGEAAGLPTTGSLSPERASTTVSVGERVAYDAMSMAGVTAADPELATSWLSGRLQFRAEPLKSVIEDVNRYSATHIIIADKSIEDLVFTGTVFQDQADDWLKGLEDVFPVEVQGVDRNTVLVRAKSPPEAKARKDFTLP